MWQSYADKDQEQQSLEYGAPVIMANLLLLRLRSPLLTRGVIRGSGRRRYHCTQCWRIHAPDDTRCFAGIGGKGMFDVALDLDVLESMVIGCLPFPRSQL